MPETHLETLNLKNGITLEIWDRSRVIAGDRWLVRLEAGADIPLQEDYFRSVPEKERACNILKKALGPLVPYRYVMEKHFVDGPLKENLLNEYLATLKRNALAYLEHPDFPRRFVLSKYRELKRKDPRLFQGS